MAKTANSANVKRDIEGPDYKGAIDLVRGRIRSNQSESRSLAQDNSTLYKRIDKEHGVHTGAAKDFAKIDGMAPEKRTDYLRSLLGMLGFAGYDNFDDLVDRAQKPAPTGEGKDKVEALPADEVAGEDHVDLKTGMIVSADGKDVRDATPEELAAERDRIADFSDDDAPGNIHPFPAKAH
jgi:hypothetical protein